MKLIEDMDKEKLRNDTNSHICHVITLLSDISYKLKEIGKKHDHTKEDYFDEFYDALNSGNINNSEWYEKHFTEERHHLLRKVPEDVNLLDVLEQIADCIATGLIRGDGKIDYNYLKLSNEVLQNAYMNTAKMLENIMKERLNR
jgi:hypothetical protein